MKKTNKAFIATTLVSMMTLFPTISTAANAQEAQNADVIGVNVNVGGNGIGTMPYAKKIQENITTPSGTIVEIKVGEDGIVKPITDLNKLSPEDIDFATRIIQSIQNGENKNINAEVKTNIFTKVEKEINNQIKTHENNVKTALKGVAAQEHQLRKDIENVTGLSTKGIPGIAEHVDRIIVEQPYNQQKTQTESQRQNPAPTPKPIDRSANGVTSPEENRDFLMSITSPEEFKCADSIINRESKYITTATNPYSGAYGVAQSYPAGKYASHGGDWRTNGKTQILWMQDYVHNRYGGWCNALNFHNGNGWY